MLECLDNDCCKLCFCWTLGNFCGHLEISGQGSMDPCTFLASENPGQTHKDSKQTRPTTITIKYGTHISTIR